MSRKLRRKYQAGGVIPTSQIQNTLSGVQNVVTPNNPRPLDVSSAFSLGNAVQQDRMNSWNIATEERNYIAERANEIQTRYQNAISSLTNLNLENPDQLALHNMMLNDIDSITENSLNILTNEDLSPGERSSGLAKSVNDIQKLFSKGDYIEYVKDNSVAQSYVNTLMEEIQAGNEVDIEKANAFFNNIDMLSSGQMKRDQFVRNTSMPVLDVTEIQTNFKSTEDAFKAALNPTLAPKEMEEWLNDDNYILFKSIVRGKNKEEIKQQYINAVLNDEAWIRLQERKGNKAIVDPNTSLADPDKLNNYLSTRFDEIWNISGASENDITTSVQSVSTGGSSVSERKISEITNYINDSGYTIEDKSIISKYKNASASDLIKIADAINSGNYENIPPDFIDSTNNETPEQAARAMQDIADSIKKKTRRSVNTSSSNGDIRTLQDALITEGDFNSFYDNIQNKKDSPVYGKKLTDMTIGEVIDLTTARGEGSYHQYTYDNYDIRTKDGKKAGTTAAGKPQFIGSTLKEYYSKAGYSRDDKFDEEAQINIAYTLAEDVIKNAKPKDESESAQKARRDSLKETWIGFKNLSDSQLDNVIDDIRNGNRPQSSSDSNEESNSIGTPEVIDEQSKSTKTKAPDGRNIYNVNPVQNKSVNDTTTSFNTLLDNQTEMLSNLYSTVSGLRQEIDNNESLKKGEKGKQHEDFKHLFNRLRNKLLPSDFDNSIKEFIDNKASKSKSSKDIKKLRPRHLDISDNLFIENGEVVQKRSSHHIGDLEVDVSLYPGNDDKFQLVIEDKLIEESGKPIAFTSDGLYNYIINYYTNKRLNQFRELYEEFDHPLPNILKTEDERAITESVRGSKSRGRNIEDKGTFNWNQ